VYRALVVPILVAGSPVHSCLAASLTQQDLQILGSALTFVQPRPASGGDVAIVYDPGSPESRKDADSIKAAIGNGLTGAGITLTPVLVAADALSAAHFALVIVAIGANSPAVLRALQARHVLCVTGEQSAVQAGICTMAIQSSGRVDLLVNSQAAQQTGISFATAFRMMVREL
jgi:hypothetical protein